mmetsp:Transcript_15434/g.27728  ORF Transcript_15434/g.27728 Transcript_15434/m.27728 type:complete len:245 (-) Transcript_15434:1133-1867(-)
MKSTTKVALASGLLVPHTNHLLRKHIMADHRPGMAPPYVDAPLPLPLPRLIIDPNPIFLRTINPDAHRNVLQRQRPQLAGLELLVGMFQNVLTYHIPWAVRKRRVARAGEVLDRHRPLAIALGATVVSDRREDQPAALAFDALEDLVDVDVRVVVAFEEEVCIDADRHVDHCRGFGCDFVVRVLEVGQDDDVAGPLGLFRDHFVDFGVPGHADEEASQCFARFAKLMLQPCPPLRTPLVLMFWS